MLKVIIPILLMLVITPFTPWLDKTITGFFYDPNSADHFVSNPFLDFLYNYGFYPAWGLFIVSVIVLIFSKKWRNPSLVLILTFIIGAGVITHLILKDHWGRPRPKQVIEFGGTQEFRPYYSPNFFHQPVPSKSFPCGHCSTGFFFFALALVGKRLNSPVLTYAGWTLAIVLGVLLGAARIMQGAHFLSDVLMSALLLWLTALSIDRLVYSGD